MNRARARAKHSAKGSRDRDQPKAEEAADLAIMFGNIREDQRAGYIRGWLNRGFYK